MLQNLRNSKFRLDNIFFVYFARIGRTMLDNLVDVKKCFKTRIFLQRSVPIQPKTSDNLPKFCRSTLVLGLKGPPPPSCTASACRRRASRSSAAARSRAVDASATSNRVSKIGKILQFFGGLVLGCIKTNFCKKMCVWQRFSSSTRFAYLCTRVISKL